MFFQSRSNCKNIQKGVERGGGINVQGVSEKCSGFSKKCSYLVQTA